MIENVGEDDGFTFRGRYRDRMSQTRELCFASLFNVIEVQEHRQDSYTLRSFSFVIIVVKVIPILQEEG
jgi:hypothetical protein